MPDDVMSIAISWLFLAYFVILFGERGQSLVRIFSDSEARFFRTGFDAYVDTIAVLSMLATVVLLATENADFWRSLFDGGVCPDYQWLTVTAGVILVSGMVHTEFTIAPIQFASYGMLIAAMVLRTVQLAPSVAHPFRIWYSLGFLTVFSMAIPVMYHSDMKKAALFHVIEAITALVLVFFFTWMLRDLFLGNGIDLLRWLPMMVAAVADAIILAMRWKESVNSFVLIFIIVSAAVFAVGKVLFAVIR